MQALKYLSINYIFKNNLDDVLNKFAKHQNTWQ